MNTIGRINAGIQYQVNWYWFLAKHYAREMWQSLPGPWYVKVLLVVVCQVIPGPLDEVALIAISQAWRRYRVNDRKRAE